MSDNVTGRCDYSHLHAIEQRLQNEQSRLAAVAGRKGVRADRERAFRQLQIESAERELRDERKFLGLSEVDPIDTMTIDELMAELRPIPTPVSKTGPALKSKALRGDRSRAHTAEVA